MRRLHLRGGGRRRVVDRREVDIGRPHAWQDFSRLDRAVRLYDLRLLCYRWHRRHCYRRLKIYLLLVWLCCRCSGLLDWRLQRYRLWCRLGAWLLRRGLGCRTVSR